MRGPGLLVALGALLLAGCAELDLAGAGDPGPQPATTGTAGSSSNAEAPLPDEYADLPVPGSTSTTVPIRPAPEIELTPDQVPSYYMAIQQSGGQPVSVVFAVDQNRDGNPSNDPAIRLTPENGKCNPAEMRSYTFPKRYASKPVYSFRDLRQGVTVRELPAVMAVAVTEEMMALGLAEQPQDTHPQNVCSRKLWEQLIFQESARAQAAAGQ